MNIRNVLKTYSLLRTLSDDETALLNTLRGMNESERELLVSSLSPTPQKKTSKKSNKGASKSPRASSLQAQIQGRAKGRADESDDDNRFDGAGAQAARSDFLQSSSGCSKCGSPEDYPIHDPNGGYVMHHPFVSPSSAQRVGEKSSSSSGNGSPGKSAASSETEKEGAGVAASGGD